MAANFPPAFRRQLGSTGLASFCISPIRATGGYRGRQAGQLLPSRQPLPYASIAMPSARATSAATMFAGGAGTGKYDIAAYPSARAWGRGLSRLRLGATDGGLGCQFATVRARSCSRGRFGCRYGDEKSITYGNKRVKLTPWNARFGARNQTGHEINPIYARSLVSAVGHSLECARLLDHALGLFSGRPILGGRSSPNK